MGSKVHFQPSRRARFNCILDSRWSFPYFHCQVWIDFIVSAIALAIGFTTIVWVLVLAKYHHLALGAMLFFAMTCCFPAEFASVQLGGLTLTLDRAWLILLGLQYAWDIRCGRAAPIRFIREEPWLIAFIVWLALRTITQPLGSQMPEQPSTLMHFINGYLIPVVLYWMLRSSRVTVEQKRTALLVIIGLGVYLSLTAILEVMKVWGLVFPKFIADPTLGIHFGRARGPMLQSVRLGICLNLFLIALWVWPLLHPPGTRWPWILAILLTPLALAAILATYTRSVWMGCGLIITILLATLLHGRLRTAALSTLVGGGLVGALLIGPHLVAFKREYSEAETRESTYMRAAFAYVSLQMFQDKPLTGFGFNQFQIHNRPYLFDRSTDIRLESIRGYVHHNSYLSILVDLGAIGLLLFAVTSLSKLGECRQFWIRNPSPESKAACVLFLGVAGCHAIQMAFHEVSFSSIENGALAIALGWMMSANHPENFSKTASSAKAILPYRVGIEKLSNI